jgi:hypothetical protein
VPIAGDAPKRPNNITVARFDRVVSKGQCGVILRPFSCLLKVIGKRLGKTNSRAKAENHKPENKNCLFHKMLLWYFIFYPLLLSLLFFRIAAFIAHSSFA